jgi:type III pantothenate kinase
MTLLVDIGNTRFKWARARGAHLAEIGSARYRPDSIDQALDQAWSGLDAPHALVACSVARAEIAPAIARWAEGAWGVRARFVTSEARAHGVVNAYAEPEHLGADRWAALIGARRRGADATCVADCGTAATVDALNADGHHLGGLIVPGIRLMQEALVRNTGCIREASGIVAPLLARSTHDAVTTGALYALVSLIERVVADVGAELGTTVHLLVTGGDAELVRGRLRCESAHAPHLVLEGLALIAEAQP